MPVRKTRGERPHVAPPDLPLRGNVFVLLTAAGSSLRFGEGKKECFLLSGKTVLQRSIEAFLGGDAPAGVVVTYPAGSLNEIRESIDPELTKKLKALPRGLRFVRGGFTRQVSVARGLAALLRGERAAAPGATPNAARGSDGAKHGTARGDVVLVHDAARPWLSPGTVSAVLARARIYGACIPLCDFADTPKEAAESGFIAAHPSRDSVKAAQTPQGFALRELAAAHRAAAREGWQCTDDASLWDRYVGKVAFVPGDRKNKKITYREDLPSQEGILNIRAGEGWDIHLLAAGRKLLLGGVPVEHEKGEVGHSDGDVLWHAIIDALLGAAGLGDIGAHFPPSSSRWKDADSGNLARIAVEKVRKAGWEIGNIDCTVIIEKPKLAPLRDAIRLSIARVLTVAPDAVSVKAKTNEGLGEIGLGLAVEARALALLVKSKKSR